MTDPRDIANGSIIPSEGYCDQPYVVKTHDGAWLCTMTTGRGHEGDGGQHIVSCRSTDRGRTWSPLTDIEPANGPEASWVMPLITPSGRVYVFYTYNADNLREVISATPGEAPIKRVDTLGRYAIKYSDDGGKTWTKQRWYIPVRPFDIDRRNPYGGKVVFFWGVGKPIVHERSVFVGFSKVGGHAASEFMFGSEGCFLRSDNLLTESDPDRIEWQTLPDGEAGLRAPGGGRICEEANLTALSDGTLFATCRTTEGHPLQAYSRDGGRTWASEYMRYAPGGPLVCHPRAANFVRKLHEGPYAGRFIYWFHNNGAQGYDAGSRNPVWLLGGIEHDSPEGNVIHWGRPEIVLYDLNLRTGISYPDFIEDGIRLFITETQKTIARVHEVPSWLLARLWTED
jgi:hypothetical protein